jgi:hypothetical protein
LFGISQVKCFRQLPDVDDERPICPQETLNTLQLIFRTLENTTIKQSETKKTNQIVLFLFFLV